MQAATYGTGYKDIMNAWMVYGPFDLSDANDATLEFDYYNSSEPGFDKFWWLASKDGTNYSGFFLSDTSKTSQFQFKSFDLKNVPTLGNITGENGIYVAFLFQSDSLISNYWGALVDNVVLKKFVAIQYPTTITLSNTFQFNDLSSSSYRMIGLPGNQTTKISNIISGTQKKDWDAFYDNGSTSSSFLQEFDGSSIFNFSAGKGFWILSKNPFTVNASVNTVTLAADNTFSISLHSGFNIISNPFEKNVSWADVQNLNGLNSNDVLFDWTGIWNNATQMEPYKGYYFNNNNNLTSLKIPYNFNAAKISNNTSSENYPVNFLKLSLLQDSQVKSYTVAGFNSSAKKDYDKFDIFAPPGYFDEVRINIEDQNLSGSYKQLSVDYRPGVNEGQSYNLKIKNTTKQIVKLIADGIENFSDYEVYLVDNNLNKFYNLKEQNEISISPIHEKSDFQLLIGNESYINKIRNGNAPTEYALYQNYPNPFNPSTLIKYQIRDEHTFVELKIFNVLGKEIKTLVNEIQGSGIQEIEFNAADFSSGVYFYSIKAGSYSATKKMILLK